LFPQYIFPALQDMSHDPALVVRVAFSECLTTLAESSKRWMEVGMAMRLHKAINTEQGGEAKRGAKRRAEGC
jgi:phosphoinositide-3-kinase regulatory subunit 4